MKKFLFLAAAALLTGTALADEQADAELQLEKEAEAFEKSAVSTDPKAIEALKWRREWTKANRYKYYQQALKKNGDRILEAMNPPECKYYSTEGVCALLNTKISPYPKIAHVNTILNYKFPRKLGGCTAQSITVYPSKDLGYSIKYIDEASNTYADVYVYDMPKSDGPVSIFSIDAILTEEVRRVAAAYKIYRNVRFDENISRGYFRDSDKTYFLCFGAEFDAPFFNKQNKEERCYSFSLLFSKNQKFVKLRITKSGGDPKDFDKFLKAFLADFERKVILDSQTRKRKFEKAETYPIILPE